MPKTVADIMTPDPLSINSSSSVAEAAKQMKENDIGDVLVRKNDELWGILTDRDIVLRVVAEGRSPEGTRVEEVCSSKLTTVTPDEPAESVLDIMKAKAIRRLPVVKGGKPVGIVSLGDLAVDLNKDPETADALAGISAAPPNT